MNETLREALDWCLDYRASALLAPFAAMGGDWAMPAYHDLEADVVVWGPSAGRCVTAGDVRAARRYLDGGAGDEPDYRPTLATPPSPSDLLAEIEGLRYPPAPSDPWRSGWNAAVGSALRAIARAAPTVPAGDERERLIQALAEQYADDSHAPVATAEAFIEWLDGSSTGVRSAMGVYLRAALETPR